MTDVVVLGFPRSTYVHIARLVLTHKAVVVIGASIHASEIGATQAANELLFTLASAVDSWTTDLLRNVVVIVIPMLVAAMIAIHRRYERRRMENAVRTELVVSPPQRSQRVIVPIGDVVRKLHNYECTRDSACERNCPTGAIRLRNL